MAMQLPLQLETSLTLTSWLEDFRVKHSALLVKNKDLVTREERSFLISHGFVKRNDPDIWYLKTLGVYYLTDRQKLSKQYLGFLPIWGMGLANGRYLTAKITAFPKTAKESYLSDILEDSPDELYFLSGARLKTTMDQLIENLAKESP